MHQLLRQLKHKYQLTRLKLEFEKRIAENKEGTLRFTCNICGGHNLAPKAAIARELSSCYACGSTMRYRSIINALTLGLYQTKDVLPRLKVDKSKRGVGISDAPTYALPLAHTFDYQNTFYHKKPYLDVTISNEVYTNSLDFIVISDVLEHVIQPIQKAFDNIYSMLKPGGICVITVPCTNDDEECEHYPNLYKFNIMTNNGVSNLYNTTEKGEKEEYKNLIFHGGQGLTLEMRIFSLKSLQQYLINAGFTSIEVLNQDCIEFGILWQQDRSTPIIARKTT